MSICVFGDSIVWGAYDPINSGWVTLLRNHIERNWEKYNNPVVTQSDFRQNLAELTKLAKKYSNNIVYIGLTPTDDKVTHPFDNENIFEFAQTEIYNKIIQLHCKNE